jgi:hypothetical protein
MNSRQQIQITTSFPNESKHIDYVIAYKAGEEKDNLAFVNAMREEFFQKLRQENVDVKLVEFKDKKENLIFALLNCSNERLMFEAEKMKLAVEINKV